MRIKYRSTSDMSTCDITIEHDDRNGAATVTLVD